MKKRFEYEIKTLADTQLRDIVFVPNSSAKECIEILRYLRGYRKDFPEYDDHSIRVTGIEEGAWCSPKVYKEAYCPPTMTCIVRRAAPRHARGRVPPRAARASSGSRRA